MALLKYVKMNLNNYKPTIFIFTSAEEALLNFFYNEIKEDIKKM